MLSSIDAAGLRGGNEYGPFLSYLTCTRARTHEWSITHAHTHTRTHTHAHTQEETYAREADGVLLLRGPEGALAVMVNGDELEARIGDRDVEALESPDDPILRSPDVLRHRGCSRMCVCDGACAVVRRTSTGWLG
jgi:hypothetical protein